MSNAIPEELVALIYSFYTGTPSIHRQTGVGVPVKLGRVWLDIIIPPGPSAEYERSGCVRRLVRFARDGLRADVGAGWRSLLTTLRGPPDRSPLCR